MNEGRIEEAFRLGRGRTRPILVKFTSSCTKEFILKNLKGSRIRIDQDYCPETEEKRRLLGSFSQGGKG